MLVGEDGGDAGGGKGGGVRDIRSDDEDDDEDEDVMDENNNGRVNTKEKDENRKEIKEETAPPRVLVNGSPLEPAAAVGAAASASDEMNESFLPRQRKTKSFS